MHTLNLKGTLLVALVLLSMTQASVSRASDGVRLSASEQEMADYLRQNALERASCTYVPLHYIDLNANLFMINAIVPYKDSTQFFESRGLAPDELQSLSALFSSLTMFQIQSASSVNFWFAPAPGATKAQLLRGMYIIKKFLDTHSSDLYLNSSHPCPGGVSVNNL